MRTALNLTLLCLLMSCGSQRRFGDVDGQPVDFDINLDRDFVSDMHRRVNASASVGASSSSRGYTSTGIGFGLHFSSTNVYLHGIDKTANILIFRKKLSWGQNRFTVPLLAERTINLHIVVTGGRSGNEPIGTIRADQQQPITISLDSDGSSMLTLDATKETVPR